MCKESVKEEYKMERNSTFITNFLVAKHKKGVSKRTLHKECEKLNISYKDTYREIVNYQVEHFGTSILLKGAK